MSFRVVKVGGSLFKSNQIGTAVDRWLRQKSTKPTVLVTGGGIWADQIRRLDAETCLSSHQAHWLAVRAMSLTTILLANLMERSTWIQEYSELKFWLEHQQAIQGKKQRQAIAVFDTENFLQEVEPSAPGTELPKSWDVTSDSIAARLAEVTGADELILLKSIKASVDCPQTAAHDGIVDSYFPQIAAALRARAVPCRIETDKLMAPATSCDGPTDGNWVD